MSGRSFPPIAELIPHSDAMLMLDRILVHESTFTVCATRVDHGALFANPDGTVPSWVGIEYMAQCAAVHGGLGDRARGQAPRPGLLLGSRRLHLHSDAFPAGESLHVTARHHIMGGAGRGEPELGEAGLVAFDCSICAGTNPEILAEGRVNLYILEDWSALGEVTHE